MSAEEKQLAFWADLEPHAIAVDLGASPELRDWFLSIPEPDDTLREALRRSVRSIMVALQRDQITEDHMAGLLTLVTECFVVSELQHRFWRFWMPSKERIRFTSRSGLLAAEGGLRRD